MPQMLRPFHPDDIHLTVSFFGRMDAARVAPVCAVLQEISFTPFEITFGSVIPLPHRKRFSAVSLELNRGKTQAVELIETWRDPLARAADARLDSRPALPHATIARPHRKANAAQKQAILEWLAILEVPDHPVVIDRIALFTWAQDRRKRQFRIVKESVMPD